MKNPGIDIKSLTAELKGLSRIEQDADASKVNNEDGHQQSLYANRSNIFKKNERMKGDSNVSPHSAKLFEIIENVNSKDHYSVDRFIYVDNDIHEVLIKLKALTKLKISHLASSLLEEFVVEHKAAIREIISKKQNKFLD